MTYESEKSKAVEVQLDPFLDNRKGSILERLKYLSSKRTTRQTAELWGISTATLNAYTNKGSMPSFERMVEISNAEGVSLDWLAYGTETNEKATNPQTSKDLVTITKYDLAASAGGGTFIDTEDSSIVTVSRSWLRQNKLINNRLCIIDARGDSMEPSIHDGDELFLRMVDEAPSKPYDGVYVINIDGLLKVKRLEYNFSMDGYRVISDNPAYPEDFVARNELEQRLRVIGEVVRVLGRPSPPIANC